MKLNVFASAVPSVLLRLSGALALTVALATPVVAADGYAFAGSDLDANNALIITTTTQTYTVSNVTSGWWSNNGSNIFHDAGNRNYIAGNCCAAETAAIYNNFFTFDLGNAGLTGDIVSASFKVFSNDIGHVGTYTMWDVTSPHTAVVANSGTASDQAIFNDLGSGVAFGSMLLSPPQSFSYLSLALNQSAIASLRDSQGGIFALGGSYSVAAVPEAPVTVMLLAGIGLVAWAKRRHTRRSSANA